MKRHICIQCGTQFTESAEPPPRCPICEEERQYVRWDGQAWSTLGELNQLHTLVFAQEGLGVTGINMEPRFAINQRALLVESAAGNVLWDCVTPLTEAAVHEIRARGGITAVAISHPHYYTTMIDWSAVFGNVPIYIHADDAQWVMRRGMEIVHWTGETLAINDEMTLIRCGGHFDGGTVMHWSGAPGGKGALFTGDIVQVVPDRRWVSFMYSYPNYIPLNATKVRRIVDALAPYEYDTIYGAFRSLKVEGDGKARLLASAERYLRAVGD